MNEKLGCGWDCLKKQGEVNWVGLLISKIEEGQGERKAYGLEINWIEWVSRAWN